MGDGSWAEAAEIGTSAASRQTAKRALMRRLFLLVGIQLFLQKLSELSEHSQ